MPPLPLRLARWFSLPMAFAVASQAGAAPAQPLASAAEVLSLTAEEAATRIPVAVTGVVTAAEPDWSGQFFVQDSSGGVFVENLHRPAPSPGDVVSVTGVSHPGAFAPIISEPRWQRTATQPLPAARLVPIENLVAGVEDGQRVEVTGIVRTVGIEFGRLDLQFAVGGYRLQVRAPLPPAGSPESLIGARVRVRGTVATHYNAALRHLTAVAVYVPQAGDFAVLQPEAVDPFSQPALPLNALAQYRRESRIGQRVHVRGTVTLQHPGEDLFLQDPSGGLRIETATPTLFAPGTAVDAAGFLEFEEHLPILRDASVRRGAPTGAPVTPRSVSVQELRDGLHEAELITLRGRLLDHSSRPLQRDPSARPGLVVTWFVQGNGLSFSAECETTDLATPLLLVPGGSVVELDGVCAASVGADGKLTALRLLLPSPAGVRVVARPSWFTVERLLAGVAGLAGLLLAVAGWSWTVSKKNAALRATLAELKRAQQLLQEAHDTLEQKVAERTAQLHFEMTARRTAEVQFKAVLAERTRLARDLHDSLEQTLTGIALQLDTAAKLFGRQPEQSAHHLELARNWLRQSQVELRRSIWDLRSRELEQFDLARALQQSTEHLVDGTAIALDFATTGATRRLPEVVEENVLRIGQEAVTNVVKHAGATRLRVALEYGDAALRLRVEDNGGGFRSPGTPAPGDNHFGLMGMTERAKRLGGRLTIDSAPGRGTVVLLDLPLEPVDAVVPAPAGAATTHEA